MGKPLCRSASSQGDLLGSAVCEGGDFHAVTPGVVADVSERCAEAFLLRGLVGYLLPPPYLGSRRNLPRVAVGVVRGVDFNRIK